MRRALLFACLAACIACGGEETVRELDPHLEVEGLPADPARPAGFLADFGSVPVDGEAVRTLVVHNRSSRSVALAPLALEPPFVSSLRQGATIPPAGTLEVKLSFRPDAPADAAVTLAIASRLGDIPLRLEGTGRPALVRCAPGAIDFQVALLGTPQRRTLTCTNDTGADTELVIPAAAGADADAFRVDGHEPGDRLQLPVGAAVEVPVLFAPDAPGLHLADLPLATVDDHKVPVVRLQGIGQDGSLVVYPQQDDCLFFLPTPLGAIDEAAAVVFNPGDETRRITSVEAPAGYEVQTRVPVVLPPDDLATTGWDSGAAIRLTFQPLQAGPHPGILRIHTDDPDLPVAEVCLAGFGGGPDLVCSPEVLDFGDVEVNAPEVQTVTCENVGQGPMDHETAVLELYGITTTRMAFHASLRHPEVRFFAPGERFLIDVEAHLPTAGPWSAAVLFQSNDAATDDERILLKANAIEPAAP